MGYVIIITLPEALLRVRDVCACSPERCLEFVGSRVIKVLAACILLKMWRRNWI